MNIQDIQYILDGMVERCTKLVSQGRRDELLNERFFHHMFSWDVARWYDERGMSVWDDLLLAPEYPTTQKFRRAGINLADETATALNALGSGRSGNLDFVIRSKPPICLEWKGPDTWKKQDVIEVLLKLLTEPESSIKVFAGILTSSSTGKRGHVETATEYFRESVEQVKGILKIDSLANLNLYAYLVTLSDNGPIRIHWGAIEDNWTDLHAR